MQKQFIAVFFIVLIAVVSNASGLLAYGQQAITPDQYVTYEKQSSFIKEFQVPVDERGLEGITPDTNGSVWFFYSTNTTSKIFNFDPIQKKFNQYQIEGTTIADDAVINLAAGHVSFDSERKAVWFTDARTNSVGKLDVTSGKIELIQIPTPNAGPMGIVLSPDNTNVWITEITGNKLAQIDAQSMEISEYSTGDDSGPTLLSFDDKGILWVSLSFSNSVLRIDPKALLSSSNSPFAFTEFKLPGGDVFSPFGIATSGSKVYVSDHGSSRLIVSDIGFANYLSYWTSSSSEFPTTLPSEVVVDNQGNIYFPQHGGNRISVIEGATGMMTEYEIPTGPLSTAVFMAAPTVDRKIWFTEWASSKIAYLDTTIQIPFTLDVETIDVTLDRTESQSIIATLSPMFKETELVSLSEVEIGLTGMTESGLRGVTYQAQPPRVNLHNASSADSNIQITAQENAKPGGYTAMIRASAPENDGLVVSRLYPVKLGLDVPEPTLAETSDSDDSELPDWIRVPAIAGAMGLIGLIIYIRIRRKLRQQH